jgi:hypothetical protein
MGCGDTLTERSTSTKEYFKISLSSINDVSLSITPTQSADYDLLVKWDGSVPSETNYDCKSENGYGQVDVCPNTGFKTLNGGTYNVMTKYYKGSGTYDISLSCKQTITTTTVIPSFDANSFTCSLISNGYRCQLNYTNNLDQDANVFFLFSDSKGKILSVPSQLMNAHKGSDVLSSVFLCTSNKGVYRIDWIAYLASDTMLKTPIKWSKTSETQVVNC